MPLKFFQTNLSANFFFLNLTAPFWPLKFNFYELQIAFYLVVAKSNMSMFKVQLFI